MDIYEVERLIRNGIKSLEPAIWEYWPSTNDLGIHENNLSLHVGHELISKDFAVFTQAHLANQDTRKLDLLALNYSGKVQIRIECKRAFERCQGGQISAFSSSSNTDGTIEKDIQRIMDFQFVDQGDEFQSSDEVNKLYENKYGVIIISTFCERVIDWFNYKKNNYSSKEDWMDDGIWKAIKKTILEKISQEESLAGISIIDPYDNHAVAYFIWSIK